VLNEGVVQQIDTPMALYERPANLFVAGFLGSPAMNVLHGRLLDGPRLQLQNGRMLALDGAAVAQEWAGGEVAVGVRPEHLQPAGEGEAVQFVATVEGIEPVGNEIFVNVMLDDAPLVLRVAPRPLPPVGGELPLVLRADKLHFFDAATGERL
jgi:multiple sugar transport system ATP-binding protein